MRTALKILKANLIKIDSPNIQKNVVDRWETFKNEESTIAIVVAINEARKETIIECANAAKLNSQSGWGTIKDKSGISQTNLKDRVEKENHGHGDCTYEVITVDKNSILNLINELK